jgi:hypothetical protein
MPTPDGSNPTTETRDAPSAGTAALLAGIPGMAGAALGTCGAACAGACGPSLLGVLGLSSSGAAALSWTGWLRPLFFAVSALTLAVAFYRAYRRKPPAHGTRAFSDSRAFVWLMAAITLALFAAPYGSRLLQAAPSSPCDHPCPRP